MRVAITFRLPLLAALAGATMIVFPADGRAEVSWQRT